MEEESKSLCEVYAEAYDKAFWGTRGRPLDHEIALEAVAAHVRAETIEECASAFALNKEAA